MNRPPLPALRTTLLLLLLAAVPASARVFQVWGERDTGMGSGDIRTAYRTDVRLNGGYGKLVVNSCPGRVGRALSDLQRQYRGQGWRAYCFSGDGLGWGLAINPTQVVRLFAVQLGQKPSCLVFQLTQTREDYQRSLTAPAAPPWTDLAGYPGARTTFTMDNLGSGVSLAAARSLAPAPTVLRYYQSALRENGWSFPLPARGDGPPVGGVLVGLRSRETVFITVKSTGANGESVITVLRKKSGSP